MKETFNFKKAVFLLLEKIQEQQKIGNEYFHYQLKSSIEEDTLGQTVVSDAFYEADTHSLYVTLSLLEEANDLSDMTLLTFKEFVVWASQNVVRHPYTSEPMDLVVYFIDRLNGFKVTYFWGSIIPETKSKPIESSGNILDAHLNHDRAMREASSFFDVGSYDRFRYVQEIVTPQEQQLIDYYVRHVEVDGVIQNELIRESFTDLVVGISHFSTLRKKRTRILMEKRLRNASTWTKNLTGMLMYSPSRDRLYLESPASKDFLSEPDGKRIIKPSQAVEADRLVSEKKYDNLFSMIKMNVLAIVLEGK